jgi:hypothetical protein
LFAVILLAAGLGFYFLQGGSNRDLISTLGLINRHSPQSASFDSSVPAEPAQSPGSNPRQGLGLALVRRIVEKHSGRLWVCSTPGKGSQFTFSLAKP